MNELIDERPSGLTSRRRYGADHAANALRHSGNVSRSRQPV